MPRDREQLKRATGEGSVFRRSSDGLWVSQVTRRNRRPTRYRVKYSKTEDEAWEKLEDLLIEEGWLDDEDVEG